MEKAIILADDSMIVKNIVEKAIDDEYMVLKASNGKEAIKHITDKKYEIIGMLLDLNMPESDGFMVLNYFKNNNLFKKYPVVIISGDDTKETGRAAGNRVSAGGEAYDRHRLADA